MTRRSTAHLLARLLFVPHLLAAQEPPPGLVEAEAFVAWEPGGGAGVARGDVWASGRTLVLRVPSAERIRWRVPDAAPDAGELWVRYAARGTVRLEWAPGDEAPREVRLAPTGALEGRGAWRWERLGALAGAETFALAGAPLRLDCFVVAPAGSPQPAWPPAFEVPEHDDALLAAIAASWDDAPLPWLGDDVARPLPGWYEAERTHVHTRLSAGWYDEPVFERAAAGAAAVAAGALVRHVKTMAGECSWPSALGAVAPWVPAATVDGVDPVEAMARRADAAGVAFVAYYRHEQDRPLARAHPDWVAVDHLGRTLQDRGEPSLCFQSGYGDATLARLVELVERGADAIYLDESHQPLEGCWCAASRAAFERATGLPLPAAPLLEDPLYRRFLRFTEDAVAREVHRWREVLHALDDDVVLIVSSNLQPELLRFLPTTRLAAGGDVVKTELRSGLRPALLDALGADDAVAPSRGVLMTLAWTLARDASFGRPPHVWVHGLDEAEHWRAAAGAVAATGGVANLDHREAALPEVERLGPAHALARAVGGALAGARPLGRVAVHLPERARDALLPDQDLAWRHAVRPFLASWDALARLHVAPRVVTDDQLCALATADPTGELTVLHLPAPALLTPRQARTVAALRARGVTVVEGDAEADLEATLVEPALRATGLVVEAPPEVRVARFRAPDGAQLVTLTNDPARALDGLQVGSRAVEDAVLRTDGAARVLDVLGDRVLEPSAEGRIQLPPFADVLVLRVER